MRQIRTVVTLWRAVAWWRSIRRSAVAADGFHSPGRNRPLTLEYPQHERDGPPFSVRQDEVEALYGPDWGLELLDRRAIPPEHPGYVCGVSRLDTAVYALSRRRGTGRG